MNPVFTHARNSKHIFKLSFTDFADVLPKRDSVIKDLTWPLLNYIQSITLNSSWSRILEAGTSSWAGRCPHGNGVTVGAVSRSMQGKQPEGFLALRQSPHRREGPGLRVCGCLHPEITSKFQEPAPSMRRDLLSRATLRLSAHVYL